MDEIVDEMSDVGADMVGNAFINSEKPMAEEIGADLIGVGKTGEEVIQIYHGQITKELEDLGYIACEGDTVRTTVHFRRHIRNVYCVAWIEL